MFGDAASLTHTGVPASLPSQAKCATRAMCLMAPSAAAPAAWLAKKLVTEDVLSADNDNVESVLRVRSGVLGTPSSYVSLADAQLLDWAATRRLWQRWRSKLRARSWIIR